MCHNVRLNIPCVEVEIGINPKEVLITKARLLAGEDVSITKVRLLTGVSFAHWISVWSQ